MSPGVWCEGGVDRVAGTGGGSGGGGGGRANCDGGNAGGDGVAAIRGDW